MKVFGYLILCALANPEDEGARIASLYLPSSCGEDGPQLLVPGKLALLLLRRFVRGESILKSSGPTRVGKGAAMPFSSKAQEIHDHIVSSGKADYWMGVARSLAERRSQHQPGKRYARDVPALRDKLQAQLSGAVNDANDHHWEEIAHWLVYEARLN